MNDKNAQRRKRKKRNKLIRGNAQKPRVVFYKSNLYLSAQVVDDEKGKTIFSVSTKKINDAVTICKKNKIYAEKMAEVLAGKLKEKEINEVFFDRNGYIYHGKIRYFCESLRKSRIQF